MLFASGLLPATIAVAQECLRLPFVAFPALLGAVASRPHALVVARRVSKIAQSGEWSSWCSQAESMEFVGYLAVLSDAVEGSRAFVMVLVVESLSPRGAGSCSQAWLPMFRFATSERHARAMSSRTRRSHLKISCSFQRLLLDEGNRTLAAVDQTIGGVALNPAPGRHWQAFMLWPSRFPCAQLYHIAT